MYTSMFRSTTCASLVFFYSSSSTSDFLISRTFDPDNLRSINAALHFSSKQSKQSGKLCPQTIKSVPNGELQVINSRDLSKHSDKILICQDMTTRPLNEFKRCNFDFTLPAAVS